MDYPFISRLTNILWLRDPHGLNGRNHAVPVIYRGVVNNWTHKFAEFYDVESLRGSDLRGFIGLAWSWWRDCGSAPSCPLGRDCRHHLPVSLWHDMSRYE